MGSPVAVNGDRAPVGIRLSATVEAWTRSWYFSNNLLLGWTGGVAGVRKSGFATRRRVG